MAFVPENVGGVKVTKTISIMAMGGLVNVEKVATVKDGEQLFEVVLTPKASDVTVDDLKLKVEDKYEKVVVKAPETTAPEIEKAPVKSPQTGDNMMIVAIIALAALSACAAVVIRRKAVK